MQICTDAHTLTDLFTFKVAFVYISGKKKSWKNVFEVESTSCFLQRKHTNNPIKRQQQNIWKQEKNDLKRTYQRLGTFHWLTGGVINVTGHVAPYDDWLAVNTETTLSTSSKILGTTTTTTATTTATSRYQVIASCYRWCRVVWMY